MGPANPFYPTGGSTSVHGTRVGNLTYAIEAPVAAPALDFQFTAEAFLACDTGTKDAAGREIVEVLCGVRRLAGPWTWRSAATRPPWLSLTMACRTGSARGP
jgi:hypothetical protein